MNLNLLLIERYREIIEKLYERRKEIEEKKGKKQDIASEDDKDKKRKNKKGLYYLKTLAKDLKKTDQAISETVKKLIEMGVVKGDERSGPNKGVVKYLDLTEDGVLIWNVLTLPTKDEIKNVIIEFKELGEEINASHIAEKLGKNPNDKSVMDLIYAVMVLPDIKNYKIKKIFS
jgi:DNA-binding MarR family transcriptional regulator